MKDDFLDNAGSKEHTDIEPPEHRLAKLDPQPDNFTASPALQTARLLQASNLFPAAGSVAGVFTIVQFGEEIGLTPVVALNNVAIIKGKLAMSGASMLALAFKYGVKAEYLEESEEKCMIKFTREGFPDYTSTFTYVDAEKAGLLDKNDKGEIKSDIWRKYLKTMLKWRAVSQGMKMIAPDILAGVYTAEEIESIETIESVQNYTPTDTGESSESTQNHTSKQMKFDFGKDINDIADSVDAKTQAPSISEVPLEKEWHPAATDLASIESQPEIQQETQTASGEQVEKVTAPQLKKLYVMASQSGLQSFMAGFKVWLTNIEGSGLPYENPSGKDLNKDFCSKLISSFERFSTLFFASPSTRAGIKDVFATLKEVDKKKTLKTIASYLEDISSVGVTSIDSADDDTLNNYLNLFLVDLEGQEHNKIASGAEREGLTVEQTLETLRELGFNPEVQERIELEPSKAQGGDAKKPFDF